MKVFWRTIAASRNSYAVLNAACERSGIRLTPSDIPRNDVTCYSLTSITAPAYAEEIASADCSTVVGGPHATSCPGEVAAYADFVIVGEGEYTLPRLLRDLENGGNGRVPGVMNGAHYEPATSSVVLDAFPPFSGVKGYIEISRGCPFSCGYCQTPQIFGHCMRHRSVDTIARYARRHREARFVTPNAFAYGSDGRHPRFDRVGRLLAACRPPVYLGTFPSEVRPEFICEESLALVTRYCANTRLHFGAQSGSDDVLASLGRGHTVADIIRAVEFCHDAGISPVVDFIVGLPQESPDDQRETADLIRWTARFGTVHAHRFIPLPGTPLAGTHARPVLPETEKILGSLAKAGKLTGSWNEPAIRFFKTPLK